MKNFFLFFFLLSFKCFGQLSFQGKILSQNKIPIYNVNIYDSLSKQFTNSNEFGNFEIITNNSKIALKISYVGYASLKSIVDLNKTKNKTFILYEGIYLKDSIKIYSTRANNQTPFAFTNIEKDKIDVLNNGKDLVYILQHTPSIAVTSDAGNGIGYTGIRIRGSDPTRVNVTINNIPINDAESHGVFWVNLPDILSSTNSIQVQRGVGTSTNGSGTFGGTINIKTGNLSSKPLLHYGLSVGSYNTAKHTLNFTSGIIDDKWNFEGRLSKIFSNGYIDRAYSNLKSYYLSLNYLYKDLGIQLINFSGKEKTYQSWWGTPEARIKNDMLGMDMVINHNSYSTKQANNLLESERTYNYYLYENQTDNYQQDHYQFHINQDLSKNSILNLSLHYTYGRGYYEEFKNNDDLDNYSLANITLGDTTIESTDLIRQRWLDNDFYGMVFSYLKKQKNKFIVGGGWNRYIGKHFGKIIWGKFLNINLLNKNYYFNKSIKSDGNLFFKKSFSLKKTFKLFVDVQARFIQHHGKGNDNKNQIINFNNNYMFFNPKLGVNYKVNKNSNIFFSYSRSNREPVRSDVVDSIIKPKHETLSDYELGLKQKFDKGNLNLNLYWMQYKNQLILTGAVNDVGGYIRSNVKKSKRVGIEIESSFFLNSELKIYNNITISKNKAYKYIETIYDYGKQWNEYNVINNLYEKSNLSFSPSLILSNTIEWFILKNTKLLFFSKYVGLQYLDNTSNKNRIIPSYFINNLMINYNTNTKFLKYFSIQFQINNLFNEFYESNGYTFGYYAGLDYEVRENYYYPQAERNFMFSMNLKF